MAWPSTDYLGPTAVRAAVLPARAIYLIADGSEEGLRQAVQEACTRWGGMTEPIVPVKPGGEIEARWRDTVALARADVAVNVDVPAEDASAAAQELDVELVSKALIDTVGLAAFTVHPAAIGPASMPDSNAYVLASERRALWEVVGAGDLTPEHEASLADLLYVYRPTEDEVARSQLTGRTLVERTCDQFGENWASGGAFGGPAVVWVTEPGSFLDCIYFWNLRALRPFRFAAVPMLLFPVNQMQHWLNFSSRVANALERPDEFAPDAALCSKSLSESALEEVASELGLSRYTGNVRVGRKIPAPIRKPPFNYLTGLDPLSWLNFERSYGQITNVDVQLFRDKTPVRFRSPVSFDRGGGRNLIRISGEAFASLPRRPEVANLIHRGGIWRDNGLQISAFAINTHFFELHVPELREVIDTLLGATSIRHELSEKGKPGMAWLDLTDISPLLEMSIFAAVRELTTPRSKELMRALQKLRADNAIDEELAEIAAHWGGRSERRYRSADELKRVSRAEAPRVLERLANVGWAERGLRVRCDRCGLPSFVSFPDTSERATCPGCGSPASYETGSALSVYYRLNSHLDLLSDQGVLPHLLSIAALARQGNQSHFLPGVNVWFEGNEKAEADIFGVRNGQIIAGEVKTSASEFKPEQVKRDVNLTSRLGADVHVLAAPDDISEEVTKRAEDECEAHGVGLIVLQRSDLLPSG